MNYLNKNSINYDGPYLVQIIALCKQQNIKIVLTEPPGSKDKRNSLPFEKEYKIGNQKLITIYNLNNFEVSESIIDASTEWLIPDHLNQFGGRKNHGLSLEKCVSNAKIVVEQIQIYSA